MLKKKLFESSLFLPLSLFLLSVIFVNPLGEFVINDDWIFSRQVLAFSLGKFTMSSLIDPVFIAQAVLGYLWVLVFGFSHTALRILTIIVTFLTAFGIKKILSIFEISKFAQRIILLTFLFNPLVYTSAFSFMTENYFLFFFIFTLFYYLKFLKFKSKKDLFLGSLFCGLSFLVRQIGLISFLALIFTFLFSEEKLEKKKLIKSVLIGFLPLAIAILVFAFWQRFPSDVGFETASFLTNTLKSINTWEGFKMRWVLYLFALPYFAYFLVPVLTFFPEKIKGNKNLLIILVISVVLFYPIYKFDLFPIGSVFYLEGLHVKSFAQHNLSVFDNIVFKIFLSSLISFSTSYLLYSLTKRSDLMKNNTNKFLIMVIALNVGALLFSADFYDRYLLVPGITLLIFYSVNYFRSYELAYSGKIATSVLILFIAISFFLQIDFFQRTRLSWQQASLLRDKYELVTNIYLLGPYDKYMYAVKNNNFDGYDKLPSGEYKCFVYNYTLDTDSQVLKVFERVDDHLDKGMLKNPRIYEGRKPSGQPRIKNNLHKLEYDQQYFSFLYNPIGKKAYVGSFCI